MEHSFCDGAEEDDPSEDFEEYMACAVCGDNGGCVWFFVTQEPELPQLP